MPAHAQSQNGHAKCRHRVSAGLAEPEEFIEWNLQLGREIGEITHHHFARKRVIPCRHGRMGGKDIGGSDNLEGRIEIEVVLSHMQTDPLQRKERRVPFIHMKDFRFPSQGT
jgi:hypothetical protein